MGTTFTFLALGDDCEEVPKWFAGLSPSPAWIDTDDGAWIWFETLGPLNRVNGSIDTQSSPVVSYFRPVRRRGVLWTAAELHFLATPLRRTFPELHQVSRKVHKWLGGIEPVWPLEGKWDYYLEGSLRNVATEISAFPEAASALRSGQYFVSHGDTPARLDTLCKALRLRGVDCHG
jgi:hypothetical protein